MNKNKLWEELKLKPEFLVNFFKSNNNLDSRRESTILTPYFTDIIADQLFKNLIFMVIYIYIFFLNYSIPKPS